MKTFALLIIMWIMGIWQLHCQYYDVSIKPVKQDLYISAKYRIWIPEPVRKIRGIIIRQHGCGINAKDNGLNHANDLQWQALAKKYNMALLGTELIGKEACSEWFNIEGGSGKALLKALKKLAKISNHSELEEVPWALWGHSGGAYWCTDILFEYPEKVLCAIPRSGGLAFTKLWNPLVKQVPVLWMAGENDLVDGFDYVREMTKKSFYSYRRYGAIWSIAIDPKADHGNRKGRSFAIRWMDAVLSMRLSNNGNNPIQLDSHGHWLGNLETNEIKTALEVKNELSDWGWLPNEDIAKNWQEFVQTGWVSDSTPPPIPLQLKIERSEGRCILSWKSEIDIESGIKQFNIYRDNELMGIVHGQEHNFHDAPEPVDIKFEFIHDLENKDGQITIESENFQGIKGFRSQGVYDQHN
ncbi:hypothetical protein [Arenibacter troitsensis]|uniref:Uncharacterized protein n=1 Tax=Arenibacter troitsensis TaxID=188872 RepID=A0A1X7KHT2_9FLAO|nr:hypothetical protein [Arenibacter troitsensis]SMG40934.1 hypothetical protein SAMN03080602_02928 [Arenibacter troitsensis]